EKAMPELADQMRYEIDNHRTAFSQNHSSFLEARKASLLQLREMIKLQIMIKADTPLSTHPRPEEKQFTGDSYLHPDPLKPSNQTEVIWDEKDLLEFAGGKIANVFGKEYEIIDSYKYRVRLPLPPYLLVNRVTKIDAKRGEFKPSTLTTEYDISKDAWYCVDGQIPWAIASEAGQCDLLLISYLGIDFSSKGDRYYRLTDYTMTFMDELPKAGDVLRYDIHIDSFMKSGESLFFDFGYDCYVKDKLVYRMTGGRAGFSTDAELAKGKGIFLSKMEEKQRAETPKQHFAPLLRCDKTSFNRNDLLNITRGNLSSCFGPQYDQRGKNPSLRFAAEEIMMLDRIVSIGTSGGPWGLGEIIAQKDLAPDHWYFPCHFKDDNVLAGTLVTEGCVQLLGFYMLYLGLQVNTQDARFQPVKNHPYGIRARGQIVPTDKQYTYKMEIVEIGLEPRPFARANFYIILEGKIVVDFKDLGVELVEKTPSDPAYRGLPTQTVIPSKKPLFDSNDITEFAVGSLTKCFGPEYAFYDGKKGPRQPNGDLQLVTRVMELTGTRHNFKEVSEIVTEYDVPADAWFFQQNSCPVAPYSILMEIALQPCGFLSTYMGVTLIYPDLELCFRNNASDATLLQNIDIRGKTITAKAKMTSVAKAAETVVLYFDYELICDNTSFYKGSTQFGYYTPKALSMQRGLDRGEKLPAWFEREQIALSSAFEIDLKSTEIRQKLYQGNTQKPYYRLPHGQLDFLDKAYVFEKGGKYSKGYVYARKKVDATDWFYSCHFFRDPVMPGSLGVEAILQAMKIFSLRQDLGKELKSPYFTNVPGLTKWKYRGQINPDNKTMDLEVHIKKISVSHGQVIITADASLWKNKLRIYEITDAAIALIGEQ
ncbi:3-hydroxyacyl-[acyl-carrier-protein] dehydratase FabA, partial [bacterium]|nr:3-hydroxyacyl-[acyl-carrier-protein] dehydratase FabA [bacterium]